MLVHRPSIPSHLRFIVFCLAAVLAAAPAYGTRLQQYAVVQTDRLNVRAAPDTDARVIRVLEKNERVRVLMEKGDWLQVAAGESLGYIYGHAKYVERFTEHRVTHQTDEDLEVAMARAREIERRIREKQKELKAVSREKTVLTKDLETLDREAAQNRRKLQSLMKEAEETGASIRMLENEARELRRDLEQRKTHANERIIALYKLCRLGRMNLLATAESASQLFLRKAAIERVVGHDEAVLQQMQEQKQELENVLAGLRDEREKQEQVVLEYEETLTRLAQKRNQRRQMIASLENRKSGRQQTLESLRDAAARLEKTISALKTENESDDGDFASHRGLLKMPVQGKITSKFGKTVTSDSGVMNYSNGLELSSARGEPVRAVFDGKVAYADWLRGYGQVVILSHGEHYHTVYAHISDLFCAQGETVKTGQVIATVGDTGSRGGPALYFEVRHQGKPVDPLKWIDSSIQSDNG
ncbi:MAG: peptidoglycan DD-metalloendopeptidase family protein [Desulfosalsimonas sp.]|uniref:peptidoglycan DD-metalloendopeptidase family protein n=1 Tax=Desulfosalsimonas sp. TaxID=3073848 RepID=UPI003970E57B